MNTFINERCGTVDKVVLRLSSTKGDIDYVLIPRGQNLFALTKNINQISNFDLYDRGVFLAYRGNVIITKEVFMKKRNN